MREILSVPAKYRKKMVRRQLRVEGTLRSTRPHTILNDSSTAWSGLRAVDDSSRSASVTLLFIRSTDPATLSINI